MALNFACQPFVTADELLDGVCACDLDAIDDAELIDDMIDQASDMLSMATGGIVSGICQRTVRPVALCGEEYDPFYPTYRQYPLRDWRRQFGGLNSIPLRAQNPDIVSIHIDGAVISPSDYGLLEGKYLFRRSADWPTVNDLRKADTQVGTFSITYRFGRAPDRLARMACIELACELIKDAKGKPSGLPRGVTSANIQGASIQVRPRAEALRDGDEQIPVVSRFMSLWAPEGMNQVTGVWAPELEQFWNLVEVDGPSGS